MKSWIFPLLFFYYCSCSGQPSFGTGTMTLQKVISLPGVRGRIDHMDVNLAEQVVFVAALGNNTVEVVDLKTGKRVHSISGLDEPQGVGYIPETGELVVANGGSGDCYFYNSRTFERTATVHFSADADDVRYDPTEKKVYVGYGAGAIGIIDAITHQQAGDVKLPAHPEGFQLDKKLNELVVNLPDAHIVGVVDLKNLKLIKRWNTGQLSANFPIAPDAENQRLFIGYRHPAKLVIIDSRSGTLLSSSEMISDVDDLYYDGAARRVYVSGGGGAIEVFEERENRFEKISHIPSRPGARTSLFIPSLKLFVLAERANSSGDAQLLVYKIAK